MSPVRSCGYSCKNHMKKTNKVNQHPASNGMSEEKNIALYRKYRPSKFAEVMGQEHITNILVAAIKAGKVGHAYLFSGSRGIGKTTIARILANELGVSSKDLYEIDAASHTGVDDIRDIREGVHTLPFDSPYKIYILDEAHMLSKSAFNALLKTLEEPPAHVIFMLATTEPEKLPDTIISRCENYVLKQPTRSVLRDVIQMVAKKEGREIGKSAAELVALLADGSFRDGLGTLQKVLSASKSKKIKVDEVENITGAPRGELLNKLVGAIAGSDIEKALEIVANTVEENLDLLVFQQLLLHRVRAVLLLKVAPSMITSLKEQFNTEDFKFLEELAKRKESNINSKTLLALLDAYANTKSAYIKHLPLELALVELLS